VDRRARLELAVRSTLAVGVAALLPLVYMRSHSMLMMLFMTVPTAAMFYPSARATVVSLRDAVVRIWQRLQIGRNYLLVVLLDDYRRHVPEQAQERS
jgi:hypothetical protein